MDEFGIDTETALPFVRKATDLVAEHAVQAPGDLSATATVPFVNADYVEEFEQCVVDHDAVGVQLFSNVQGKPLDAPEFDVLFDVIERTDVPVLLHPQLHE